jgi:ssDNA-binding Zn-finger/Zn-ribbon topoisomerase 1
METTEAPVSQTIKLSYKGCEILLTQRDLKEKMKPFLDQAKLLIDGALSMGFEAPPARGFAKKEVKYVPGKVCPKCGSRLVEKTKADGHVYYKCEKGGWDRVANKPTGCEYVDWNNQIIEPLPADVAGY